MKHGWIAKVENLQTQERVHTLYACSKQVANRRLATKIPDLNYKIELVSPYAEFEPSSRVEKEFTGDLSLLMRELSDLNPLLIKKVDDVFIIEIDRT